MEMKHDYRNRKYYQKVKSLVLSLDHGRCHVCHKKVKPQDLVLDHIIPKSSFGLCGIIPTDEYWNLRLAHRACNASRRDAELPGQLRLPIPIEEMEQI